MEEEKEKKPVCDRFKCQSREGSDDENDRKKVSTDVKNSHTFKRKLEVAVTMPDSGERISVIAESNGEIQLVQTKEIHEFIENFYEARGCSTTFKQNVMKRINVLEDNRAALVEKLDVLDNKFKKLDKRRKIYQFNNTKFICPICQELIETFREGNTVETVISILPCMHLFHFSCLSGWKEKTCPVCKLSYEIVSMTTLNKLFD